MHRGLWVVALLAAMPARAQQAGAPDAARPEPVRKTRIAVLDVQHAGAGDRKTVEGLSALLASEVARRPSLVVVAGADLRALVGFERQKQLLGCTESSCMAELAGALGVTYLVSSEVSKVGSTWLLSLTLLDPGRATALRRLTRKAYSDDGLVEETSAAVDDLLSALPGAGVSPARAAGAAPSPPPATPAPAPLANPGSHRHDGGFLRFHLGGSAAETKGAGLTISGPAVGFAFAAGYSLGDHFVVYGELFDEVDASPKVNGQGAPAGTKVTHTLVGVGVGVAYYLVPFNAYLSLTGGVGSANLDVNGQTFSTENGPIARLSVGKEWWVSDNWGLGIAFNIVAGSMKDKGPNADTMKSSAFGLAFSATYN